MKSVPSGILCAGLATSACAGVIRAESASLTIVTLRNGMVIERSNGPIETRFVRGTAGDHLHVDVSHD